MKKDLGVKPYLFPMPVLMIATYGDGDKVDVMNMAWGGVRAENMVSLNIDDAHKTSENIRKRGAFTLSMNMSVPMMVSIPVKSWLKPSSSPSAN